VVTRARKRNKRKRKRKFYHLFYPKATAPAAQYLSSSPSLHHLSSLIVQPTMSAQPPPRKKASTAVKKGLELLAQNQQRIQELRTEALESKFFDSSSPSTRKCCLTSSAFISVAC
jgi:hypothetical protein